MFAGFVNKAKLLFTGIVLAQTGNKAFKSLNAAVYNLLALCFLPHQAAAEDHPCRTNSILHHYSPPPGRCWWRGLSDPSHALNLRLWKSCQPQESFPSEAMTYHPVTDGEHKYKEFPKITRKIHRSMETKPVSLKLCVNFWCSLVLYRVTDLE